MRHILSANEFNIDKADSLFRSARDYQSGFGERIHHEHILASLFFEPSTRTRLSFEAGMMRLGGHVLSVENAFDSSSDKKGESLSDTIRTISQFASLIVLRHPQNDAANIAAQASSCSLINAGCGSNEHPTQALIDLYTVWLEKRDALTTQRFLIIGDLKHGRTIHSLTTMLEIFGIEYECIDMFDKVSNDKLSQADVVYLTRFQQERWNEQKENGFVLSDVSVLKKTAMILHPMPRGEELPRSIDKDKRAFYFKQIENGMYLRMALIKEVLT